MLMLRMVKCEDAAKPSPSDECQVTPVIHVLQYPGCVPKPIPSFACTGRCSSYLQVRFVLSDDSLHAWTELTVLVCMNGQRLIYHVMAVNQFRIRTGRATSFKLQFKKRHRYKYHHTCISTIIDVYLFVLTNVVIQAINMKHLMFPVFYFSEIMVPKRKTNLKTIWEPT